MQIMRKTQYVREFFSFYVQKRGRTTVTENFLHVRRKKILFLGEVVLIPLDGSVSVRISTYSQSFIWDAREKKNRIYGLIKPQFY